MTSVAYDTYVQKNQLKQKIDYILSNPSSAVGKSQEIKVLFTVETFPDDLKQEILTEMGKIASGRVAVRSNITTLFPIDTFEQDGKLRAYLSAGTVLLGMKEPLTPLGFDMLSQMFPTIINVMTMRKKPIDNSFVKYTGCRLYLDITYLLASKLAANVAATKNYLGI